MGVQVNKVIRPFFTLLDCSSLETLVPNVPEAVGLISQGGRPGLGPFVSLGE